MSSIATVNLYICSLSFKSLEFQEENDDLQFFSTQDILRHIEKINDNQFKFKFQNGPQKK